MTCEPFRLPDGTTGIVCSRGKPKPPCAFCGNPSRWLCDFSLGRGKTCDAPICGGCRVNIGPDRDLCPEHQRVRPQLELRLGASTGGGALGDSVPLGAPPPDPEED